MAKGRNKVRVVSAEHDGRQLALAAALVSAGVPEAWSLLTAAGCIMLLRSYCQSQCTDVVGTGDDVEVICGWKGPTRSLAGTLARHGYLVDVAGAYCFTDVVKHLPDFIRKRWCRTDEPGYKAAVARAMAPEYRVKEKDLAPQAESESEVESLPTPTQGTDLFGQPLAGVTNGHDGATRRGTATGRAAAPGHQEFIQWWETNWPKHEQQRQWVWQPKHFAAIKRLLGAAGDYQTLCNWGGNFLRNREPFYRGHDLCIFLSHVNKFTTAAIIGSGQVGAGVQQIGFDPSRVGRAAVTGRVELGEGEEGS